MTHTNAPISSRPVWAFMFLLFFATLMCGSFPKVYAGNPQIGEVALTLMMHKGGVVDNNCRRSEMETKRNMLIMYYLLNGLLASDLLPQETQLAPAAAPILTVRDLRHVQSETK